MRPIMLTQPLFNKNRKLKYLRYAEVKLKLYHNTINSHFKKTEMNSEEKETIKDNLSFMSTMLQNHQNTRSNEMHIFYKQVINTQRNVYNHGYIKDPIAYLNHEPTKEFYVIMIPE